MLTKNQHILITGGRSGFGHLLANYLVAKDFLHVTLILNPFLQHPQINIDHRVRHISLELLDLPLLQDFLLPNTHIIHNSIIINTQAYHRTYTHEHNLEGTTNLINLAIDLQLPITYIGSALGQCKSTRDTPQLIQNLQATDMQIKRGIEEGLKIQEHFAGAIVHPDLAKLHTATYQSSIPVASFVPFVDNIIHCSSYTPQIMPWSKLHQSGIAFYQEYRTQVVHPLAKIFRKPFFAFKNATESTAKNKLFSIDFQNDTYTG